MKYSHRRSAGVSTWRKTAAGAGFGIVAGVLAVAGYSALDDAASPMSQTARSAVAVSAPNAVQPVPLTQEETVTQSGRVTAISAGWVTAQSSDGFTQTYRIAPETTAVNGPNASGPISEQFAVDQMVTIVGTVSGGTVTATALADQAASGPAGAPQDFSLP